MNVPIDSAYGTFGIGAVELVEVDAVGLQGAQRRLARRAQVLRAPVGRPVLLAVARQAALGGDDDVVAAALEGLGDQALAVADVAVVARVRVGGVDEADAGVERGVDGADRALLVGTPVERHGHLAQADRMDVDSGEGAGQGRRGSHPPSLA